MGSLTRLFSGMCIRVPTSCRHNLLFLSVTSVNRISFGSVESSTSSTSEACVIQLIPHLNLNAARLQQILQGKDNLGTFLFTYKLHTSAHANLPF